MAAETRPDYSRPDASMTLLHEVMNRPLDPGYAESAQQAAAGLAPRRGPLTWGWVVPLAVVLGLCTATAAIALRAPQPDVVAARAVIEDEIRERRAAVADLTTANEELSRQVDALQTDALSSRQPELLAALELDSLLAGTVPVSGPGVVVEIRDSQAVQRDPQTASPDGRVQDLDLQIAVNALWSAGAEAVAVNGHRLDGTSAIRSAGDAVLVDLVGVASPYRIEAVGEAQALEVAFARSPAAQHLSVLSARYGIASSVASATALELAGTGSSRLAFASPSGTYADDPLPSSSAGETGAAS